MERNLSASQDFFCSLHSLQAEEPLYGTATMTTVYLLVENRAVWGEKALEESNIPPQVKSRLKEYQTNIPNCKVLLVKNRQRQQATDLRFFVIHTHEEAPISYEFSLPGYEYLLGLDVPSILMGGQNYEANQRNQPLYLICTNGKKDTCCAKFGMAVYEQLSRLAGENAWESSHIGGHRFAANVIFLPYGLVYGRITSSVVNPLFKACQNNQILNKYLRGRSVYPQPAQAAEYLIRQALGKNNLEAFRLLDVQDVSPNYWTVRFEARDSGSTHEVKIGSFSTGRMSYESCRRDKQTPISTYTLVEMHTSN